MLTKWGGTVKLSACVVTECREKNTHTSRTRIIINVILLGLNCEIHIYAEVDQKEKVLSLPTNQGVEVEEAFCGKEELSMLWLYQKTGRASGRQSTDTNKVGKLSSDQMIRSPPQCALFYPHPQCQCVSLKSMASPF
jgi:hypothetical protein